MTDDTRRGIRLAWTIDVRGCEDPDEALEIAAEYLRDQDTLAEMFEWVDPDPNVPTMTLYPADETIPADESGAWSTYHRMNRRTPTLYTFGYSGMAGSDDLAHRIGDRVDAVIDVRYRAASRIPAWSSRTRETVERAGYGYAHLVGLGNLNYKGGPIKLKRPEDIALLEKVLRRRDVAIMCVCAEAETCHRRTISNLAQQVLPGLKVIDL